MGGKNVHKNRDAALETFPLCHHRHLARLCCVGQGTRDHDTQGLELSSRTLGHITQ